MNFPSPVASSSNMQARELVELAAVLAARGPAAISRGSRISGAAMDDYAAAAFSRQRHWTRWLRQVRGAAVSVKTVSVNTVPVKEARAWLEEILVSEALARVWGAIAHADAMLAGQGSGVKSPASRVVRRHTVARHRAMRILAGRCGWLADQDAADVDRLRRSMARWIDLLVAHVQQGLAAVVRLEAGGGRLEEKEESSLKAGLKRAGLQHIDVCEFAIEPQRAREFAEDLQHQQAAGLGRPSLVMAVASLRSALSQQLQCASPNGALNHAVATSVVTCFASEMFDATGPYHALWATRLAHRAADAERLIDELIAEESA
ncbi:MAG: hypothetical protein K8T91_03175 [Planctomycetes bacterium]|nr:hypothetical protein [Planctomycetota bacterium]